MKITWLGHAAFLLESGGYRVVLDPCKGVPGVADTACEADAVYFCPHHPDFTGACDCRKPAPGMFLAAARDLDIDLAASVMYGDKDSDRKAAATAGICEFHLVECSKNV